MRTCYCYYYYDIRFICDKAIRPEHVAPIHLFAIWYSVVNSVHSVASIQLSLDGRSLLRVIMCGSSCHGPKAYRSLEL